MNQQEQPTIHVRAPATSANLGPAFDAAGIALDWWDELEVRPAPVDAIQVSGEQAELLPTGRDNLVAVAMRRLAPAAPDGGQGLPPGTRLRVQRRRRGPRPGRGPPAGRPRAPRRRAARPGLR